MGEFNLHQWRDGLGESVQEKKSQHLAFVSQKCNQISTLWQNNGQKNIYSFWNNCPIPRTHVAVSRVTRCTAAGQWNKELLLYVWERPHIMCVSETRLAAADSQTCHPALPSLSRSHSPVRAPLLRSAIRFRPPSVCVQCVMQILMVVWRIQINACLFIVIREGPVKPTLYLHALIDWFTAAGAWMN